MHYRIDLSWVRASVRPVALSVSGHSSRGTSPVWPDRCCQPLYRAGRCRDDGRVLGCRMGRTTTLGPSVQQINAAAARRRGARRDARSSAVRKSMPSKSKRCPLPRSPKSRGDAAKVRGVDRSVDPCVRRQVGWGDTVGSGQGMTDGKDDHDRIVHEVLLRDARAALASGASFIVERDGQVDLSPEQRACVALLKFTECDVNCRRVARRSVRAREGRTMPPPR